MSTAHGLKVRLPSMRATWPAIAAGAMLVVAGAGAQEAPASRLADAAMNRDVDAVRAMVREGADPDALGMYDTPALLWVVRYQDADTARRLLDAGADPNLRNAHGVGPLHLAVMNGDLVTARTLLEAGADPELRDHAGETPLFAAARTGDPAMTKLLLAHGARADTREPRYAQTPLHVAARESSVAVARLLIDGDADVNARTLPGEIPAFRLPADNAGSKGVGIVRGGWPDRGMRYPVPGAKTPLLYSTRAGSLEMTRLLVEAGADLEQTDENGNTPLLNAILNASVANDGRAAGHFATAEYLIARGADVGASDWYGETPIWAAVDVRNLDIAGPGRDNGIDRERALRLIERLLAAGADPNARIREYPPERRFVTRLGSLSWVDFTGQTPFLRAALAGDTTVMRLLLEHGADPNIATFGGTTPLMAAAGVNWVVNQTFDEGPGALLAAVELAHSHGNDVNAVNSMGLAAIHGAANRGSNDIIAYLASHGASLDIADHEGRTPLVWAGGVFLATHPPDRKPETIALLERLAAPAASEFRRSGP
jgi:ankyrin repeat protein